VNRLLPVLFALGWFGLPASHLNSAVFNFPPGALEQAQARLTTNDPSLKPAFNALLADANKALKARPASVMDKPRAGASGDKHDYFSTAPYFWPDPSKPDGLPYVRKDGQRNPESGNEHSDSPRLGRTSHNAFTLALAYHFTTNEAYAGHAAKLLRVFFLDPATRMNPNFNQAQAIPGLNHGRGTGMIESRSLTGVADAVALLRGSPHWRKADDDAMTAWLNAFLDWALTSKNGRDERAARNNHGMFYDAQVAHLALVCGRTNLAREIISAATTNRFAAQIKPDGSQPLELARADSFMYSRFNLLAMFDLATLGEHVGVDLWRYRTPEGAGIRQALDFLVPYVEQPDQPWPFERGKKQRRMLDARLLLQAFAVYGDSRYRDALRQLKNPETERDALFFHAR
jgi:hypothetical protein